MLKNLRKRNNKKGFTLIELIVVIAILAVLALILVPSISDYVAESTKAKNLANARAVYSQVVADQAMKVDNPTYTDAIIEPNKTDGEGTKLPDGVLTVTIATDAQGQVASFEFTIAGGDGTYSFSNGELVEPTS